MIQSTILTQMDYRQSIQKMPSLAHNKSTKKLSHEDHETLVGKREIKIVVPKARSHLVTRALGPYEA